MDSGFLAGLFVALLLSLVLICSSLGKVNSGEPGKIAAAGVMNDAIAAVKF